MRALLTLLMLGLLFAVVATFVSPESTLAAAGSAWLPFEVGRGSEIVDGLLRTLNIVIVVLLGLTFALLALAVWKGVARRPDQGSEHPGSARLELFWTIGPAIVLAWLTWLQVDARARIDEAVADGPDREPALVIEVIGAQFDWRFRYAGADGVFGTLDDVTEVAEMRVPMGRTIEARLRTRDVVHSFFVPALRAKQDLVPGTTTPMRFAVDAADWAAAGSPAMLELRCAELCGWGHASMVGSLVPLDAEAFEEWVRAASAARFASGGPGGPGDAGDAGDAGDGEGDSEDDE